VLLYIACALFALNVVYAIRALYIWAGSGERVHSVPPTPDAPFVSIVVPARNEERQIEKCLDSLLAQDYPRFEVIVIDDRSEDATHAIVERIAAKDSRVKLVSGVDLPEGWVGKPWAVTQGIEHATGEWLVFTDADTIHRPSATTSAIAYAIKRGLGAVSLLPDQKLVTLPERMLMPGIIWSIAFALGPTEDIHDPTKLENALFNGQYIAIRRDAYEGVGGHEVVKNEIAEDYELALAFKRDGRFPIALVGANGLVRTRMYQSSSEIWEGFSKNFALGVRGKPWLSALGIAFMLCVSPLPEIVAIWGLVSGDYLSMAVCLAAIALTIAITELAMMRMRFPRWSSLWAPIGGCYAIAVFVNSLFRHSAGGGVTWRGRTYGPSGAPRR